MSEHMEPIPSRIYNAAVGGHVCGAVDIIDDALGLEQSSINEDVAPMPYNDGNPNGMGRIILKKTDNFKNVVEAQSGNTIFIIKYDFTLTGNVTIPVNCVLRFDGGSISGAYTLTGNNTGIQAGLVKIFNTNVILAGSWNIVEAYCEWFGNDETAVEKCYNQLGKITFVGKYLFHRTINLYGIGSIYFKPGCVVGCNYFVGPSQWLFKVDMSNGPIIDNAGDLYYNTQIIYGAGTVNCGNDCGFIGLFSTSNYHRAMLYDLHIVAMQEPTNEHVVFSNSYGVYSEVETRIDNCDFYALGAGPSVVCNLAHVDCSVSNSKFIGYRTKLKVQGSTLLSNVHCWGWNDNGYEKIAIQLDGNNVCINNLYCDAQDICFSTTSNCNQISASNVFIIGAPVIIRSENNRGWGIFGFVDFQTTTNIPPAELVYVANGTVLTPDNDHKVKFNDVLEQFYNQQTIHTGNYPIGQQMFDKAHSKPIYWNGTGWVDATGATV